MSDSTFTGGSYWVRRVVERLNLRFPTVFLLLLAVTAIDLLTPDPLPLIDELFFALLTVLFGLWKDRRAGKRPRPVKVIP